MLPPGFSCCAQIAGHREPAASQVRLIQKSAVEQGGEGQNEKSRSTWWSGRNSSSKIVRLRPPAPRAGRRRPGPSVFRRSVKVRRRMRRPDRRRCRSLAPRRGRRQCWQRLRQCPSQLGRALLVNGGGNRARDLVDLADGAGDAVDRLDRGPGCGLDRADLCRNLVGRLRCLAGPVMDALFRR